MSVLKVKVILEAYYDQEKLSWILTGGNREYLKVEDGVSVESAKNWETFPERINITAVEGMEFKTNVVPQPQEGQTEPTTLTLEKVFPLKDPQGLQWDMADLEADNCSGRNQLGEYFRDVVPKGNLERGVGSAH